nr:hypothetical protein [Tanacetum cinerariifolium]
GTDLSQAAGTDLSQAAGTDLRQAAGTDLAGSVSRPPMLNKENYVPWPSRLLRYAKSRPNGKLIRNSVLNGPYVRKMIPEPGDENREITVTETFRLQIDDELSDKELKQIKADDQAIQTILLGLPEDIYAAVDSCETAQEIWLRTKDLHTADYTQLYDLLKYNQKEVDELKAERLAKTQDPLALMENSNNPYVFPAPHQDQPSFNQTYFQQPMPNLEDITDPTTAMNMALALIAKAFKLNYSTPTNNNQRISLNLRNRQIAQPGNPAGYNDVIGNQAIQNAVQNLRVQNVKNQNGLIVFKEMEIRIRLGMTQLLIAQKEEAGIQLQAKEYDLMAAAADLDELKEVNANCILMANLQQASTSGTQTDNASVYDTDGSAEVHENYDDNEIFHMFTQEEQYTELLEPIPESHQGDASRVDCDNERAHERQPDVAAGALRAVEDAPAPPKPVPNSRQRLHLLHMDLCGPMRIASINGKWTKKIMETMNVSFDELSAMAFEQCSSKPGLQSMNSGQISLGLDLTYAPSTITT